MKRVIHTYFSLILILAGTMLHYNLARGATGTWKMAGALSTGSSNEQLMVQVDSLNNRIIYLNYSLPKPQAKALGMMPGGEIFSRIILGNAPLTAQEGEPILPVIPAKVIIPAGQTIDTISVIRGKKSRSPANIS